MRTCASCSAENPDAAEFCARRNDRGELRREPQRYERIGATGQARRLETELSASEPMRARFAARAC